MATRKESSAGWGPQAALSDLIAIPRHLLWPGPGLIGFARSSTAWRPSVTLIGVAFSSITRHLPPASLDGLLADFGVSSLHFDEARRGFSFQADARLDMRMDTRSGLTAEQVVNEMDERELANLIYEYGEERRSRTVARAIVRGRPIATTMQLARIVASAVPPIKLHIHPATKTFQAFVFSSITSWTKLKSCLRPHLSCLSPRQDSSLSAFIL